MREFFSRNELGWPSQTIFQGRDNSPGA